MRKSVARTERSEIRDGVHVEMVTPDCASLHPGYGLSPPSPFG